MPTSRLHPRRVSKAAAVRARAAGIRLGIAEYKPIDTASTEQWAEEYGSTELEFYGDLRQLARYSILLGYVGHIGPDRSILDFGCGAGVLAARAQSLPFSRWVGIDHASTAVEKARAAAPDERIEFLVAKEPPADLGEFDIVVCNEVLNCLPDPEAFLDRLTRHVAPGGHLLVSLWRHPLAVGLHRMLDERFELVDAVEARNLTDEKRDPGWRVSWHRRR
jgi:2-polyprenyl-6-hydroxyphenyl methylase/3-demethylubiquinone-9 3-methyltransferase